MSHSPRSVSFFQTAADAKTQVRVIDSAPVPPESSGGAEEGAQKNGSCAARQFLMGLPGDLLPTSLPSSDSSSALISVNYLLRLELGKAGCELSLPIGVASFNDMLANNT